MGELIFPANTKEVETLNLEGFEFFQKFGDVVVGEHHRDLLRNNQPG
jgi:hypothetical protein